MTRAKNRRRPRARHSTAQPMTAARVRAKLEDLDKRVSAIVFDLTRVGAVFDSLKFAHGLADIATILADFGKDLGAPHPNAATIDAVREPLLSKVELEAFPVHRQQTLQVLRVLERLKGHFDAVADTATTDQRAAALGELATVAAVYGQRFSATAQLLTVRSDHRAKRPVAEIAAALGVTEPEVEQMLSQAQALVDGPLEHPAPPRPNPCPAPARTTKQ